MAVEDIGNQHENVEFGLRIKEELLEDEKEMRKNMSEMGELQPVTGYLRLALVFGWGGALREECNFWFSRAFC